jgi:hypothetical protein
MFRAWFTRRNRAARREVRRPQRARLTLDILEDRWLPSPVHASDIPDSLRGSAIPTLYQGVTIDRNLLPPAAPYFPPNPADPLFRPNVTAIRPANAHYYFLYRRRTGDIYHPNNEMGAWVQDHLSYLAGALQ